MAIDTSSGTPVYVSSAPPFNKYNQFVGYGNNKDLHKDMGGTESALFNYWQQQQQNALELELWNLNNQYNSPSAQISRFQQAGLNPNLIYSQQNTSGGVAGSSQPIAAKPTNFKAQNAINAMQATAQMLRSGVDVMQAVRDVYNYAKYGESYNESQNRIAKYNAEAAEFALPYRNAQAAALGWYFGNGIPWNSPYMRSVEQSIRSGVAQEGLTSANTFLSKVNASLGQAKIPQAIAETLRINAETGRIEVDMRRLNALIHNINSDTAVKNYMLNYMYPKDLELKEQQRLNYHWMRDFMLPQQMRNVELKNQWLKYQLPFKRLDTGDPFVDDVMGFGFTNFLKGLGNWRFSF